MAAGEAAETENGVTNESTEAAPPAARPAAAERPRDAGRGERERPERRDRDRDRDDDDGRRVSPRRRGCQFCREKVSVIDYKEIDTLRRYIGERGRMEPRRKGGTCAKHQRALSQAIKRARHMALLPYTAEHVRLSGVPAGRSAPMGRR